MAHLGRHAIVIGASMGGLLAGRALADYYDEVTLVDRDALPLTCESRKGVPQEDIRTAFSLGDEKCLISCSRALPRKW
jgi:pyruvate/2-oxoglutarate dehydrogenase complex dihydrolipoamide dehydrogenase (E3) component